MTTKQTTKPKTISSHVAVSTRRLLIAALGNMTAESPGLLEYHGTLAILRGLADELQTACDYAEGK